MPIELVWNRWLEWISNHQCTSCGWAHWGRFPDERKSHPPCPHNFFFFHLFSTPKFSPLLPTFYLPPPPHSIARALETLSGNKLGEGSLEGSLEQGNLAQELEGELGRELRAAEPLQPGPTWEQERDPSKHLTFFFLFLLRSSSTKKAPFFFFFVLQKKKKKGDGNNVAVAFFFCFFSCALFFFAALWRRRR